MNKKVPNSVQDVIAQLRAEQAMRTDALASGSPPDYAAYVKIVGAISGLSIAEQLLKDLLEKVENDDEARFGGTA